MNLYETDFQKKMETVLKVVRYKIEGGESPLIDTEARKRNQLAKHRAKGFTFHGK